MSKMLKRYFCTLLLLGLALVGPSTPARAAEIKMFPDAGDLRFIPPNADLKGCAGLPNTPLCALDTWWSCMADERMDHCAAIGLKNMVFANYKPPPGETPPPNMGKAFRPTTLVALEESDLPSSSRLSQWLKPGDVEIMIEFTDCLGDKPEGCRWNMKGEESVFFRKVGRLWRLLAWSSETGEIECGDYIPPLGRHCRYRLDDLDFVDYVTTIDPKRPTDFRGFRDPPLPTPEGK